MRFFHSVLCSKLIFFPFTNCKMDFGSCCLTKQNDFHVTIQLINCAYIQCRITNLWNAFNKRSIPKDLEIKFEEEKIVWMEPFKIDRRKCQTMMTCKFEVLRNFLKYSAEIMNFFKLLWFDWNLQI